ncbi:MAG: glycine cleavage system protein GcvH [Pseudomonadota bacterium]
MAQKLYTKDHEYLIIEGDTASVGISDYAQQQLGDVVYVELPEVGKTFAQNDEAATVESVKAASEVYAPVACEILESNAALGDTPNLINEDPEGQGWFFKIKIANKSELEALMSEQEYGKFVEGAA